MMRMTSRRSFVVPAAEDVESYEYLPMEQWIIGMWNIKSMSGTGAQVAEKLSAWQRRIEATELTILNLEHSPQSLYHSTKFIADAYGMPEHTDS